LTADYRESNLIFTNFFDRRWESDRKDSADRVLIHGVNRFQDEDSSQANAMTGAAGVGGGAVSFDEARLLSRITLTADTHIFQAFELEYEADLFSNIGLMEKLTKAAGYAIAHRIDDDAAALIDTMGDGSGSDHFLSSQAVGSLAVPLTDPDIRRAVQYLEDAMAPSDNRVFVFSPAEQMNLFSVERFINRQYTDSIGNLSKNGKYPGFQATIYGLDWYMSQNVEGTNAAGHDNGIWQKECMAALVVEEMRTAEHYEISTDSTRYAAHAIYGFVEVRDDHGVYMKGL
jgi:hypothetical protein